MRINAQTNFHCYSLTVHTQSELSDQRVLYIYHELAKIRAVLTFVCVPGLAGKKCILNPEVFSIVKKHRSTKRPRSTVTTYSVRRKAIFNE